MWLLAGILLVVIIIGLYVWLRRIRVSHKWYEFVIAAVGTIIFVIGLQNYFATRAEHWSQGTQLTFLLAFGLPGLTLLLLAGLLICLRHSLHRGAK